MQACMVGSCAPSGFHFIFFKSLSHQDWLFAHASGLPSIFPLQQKIWFTSNKSIHNAIYTWPFNIEYTWAMNMLCFHVSVQLGCFWQTKSCKAFHQSTNICTTHHGWSSNCVESTQPFTQTDPEKTGLICRACIYAHDRTVVANTVQPTLLILIFLLWPIAHGS